MLRNKKFYILHGAFGTPQKNWFPWLSDELTRRGAKVAIPQFPTPEGQSIDTWMKVLDDTVGSTDRDTVLIGHSLGSTFILRMLERDKYFATSAYLAAGFTGLLGLERFDTINYSFVDHPFNWQKIKDSCSRFYLYHSDNDPYVPMKFGDELAVTLNANLSVIKDGKHLNDSAGFTKFEKMLSDILKNES